jgi:hypothetical protein
MYYTINRLLCQAKNAKVQINLLFVRFYLTFGAKYGIMCIQNSGEEMKLGHILGSISPAFGMLSGHGLFGNKDFLGSMSPLYGMLSGHGLFGDMGGGGLGGFGGMGLMGQLLGGSHKNPDDNKEPVGPDQIQAYLAHLLQGLPGGLQ